VLRSCFSYEIILVLVGESPRCFYFERDYIMKNEMIALFAKHDLILSIDEERMIAKCDRLAPRARLGVKNEYHVRYRSVERMYEAQQEFIDNRLATIEYRAKRKEEQKVKAAELAANVEVGDLFVDSWGYEQTQVDLYQVVAKPTARTVIVREIASQTVKGSEGYDCQNVRAVPNSFIGEEMKKRLDNYGGFKTSSYSCARPTTAEAEHYNSWYY
jgi:hypothetical protein